MAKLTLEHLAPYLAYGLKAEMLDYKSDYVGRQYDEIVGFHQWDKNCLYWSALTVGGSKPNIERIKPILRPLSDLTKEIEHNGEKFVPIHRILKAYCFDVSKMTEDEILGYVESLIEIDLSYTTVKILCELHFDFQGLIAAGLAVDMNTLEGGSSNG